MDSTRADAGETDSDEEEEVEEESPKKKQKTDDKKKTTSAVAMERILTDEDFRKLRLLKQKHAIHAMSGSKAALDLDLEISSDEEPDSSEAEK